MNTLAFVGACIPLMSVRWNSGWFFRCRPATQQTFGFWYLGQIGVQPPFVHVEPWKRLSPKQFGYWLVLLWLHADRAYAWAPLVPAITDMPSKPAVGKGLLVTVDCVHSCCLQAMWNLTETVDGW